METQSTPEEFHRSQQLTNLHINPDYIRRHVSRYLAATNTSRQDDSLYRIGSHANLIPDEEMATGELTTEQRQIVFDWLTRSGYQLN